MQKEIYGIKGLFIAYLPLIFFIFSKSTLKVH